MHGEFILRWTALGVLLCVAHLGRAQGVPVRTGEVAAPDAAQHRLWNFVVFLVDDLGWNDSSVDFGLAKVKGLNAHYRTPALQRLAAGGTRFREAYVHPVCTPSRASLMTGLSTIQHGITNWTFQRGKDLGLTRGSLALPDWTCNGLQPVGADVPRSFESNATLPMLLSRAGWRTIHVGKAHFGALGTAGADPLKLGFEVNIAGHAAGHPASHLGAKKFSAPAEQKVHTHDVPGLEEWKGKDVTLAEALTHEAVRAMEQSVAEKKPFFLHFAHYAVHAPIEPAARFASHYAESGLAQREQYYAQMVEDVDASLGKVLDALDRLDVAQDTLVFFLSDNGGVALRTQRPESSNAPLRGGKASGYEGGIRTPLVVRWPRVARAGALSSETARIEDILPTCLDAAGVGVPVGLDGVSLRKALAGGALPDRDLIWYYPHAWGGENSGSEPFAVLRSGKMKLLHFFEGNRMELYDLAADPSEAKDLAKEQQELARALDQRLLKALKTAGRPLPKALK
jgi:arylsulfatase A-like enzyme